MTGSRPTDLRAISRPQADSTAATLWRCGGRPCGAGECEHDEGALHRHASGPGPQYAPPIVHRVLRSAGSPLPDGVRRGLEASSGHTLRSVRIHTGAEAASSARAVDAAAYTVGDQIVFGEGRFRPETLPGLQLLAHEVTHVAQQGPTDGSPTQPLRVADAADPREVEAHHASRAMMAGAGTGPVGRASRRTLHRHKDDLVAYDGGQSASIYVINAGKLAYIGTSVSGHVGSGEHEKGAGPIPAGWYTLHPGVTNKAVTKPQGGVCGANPISQGYQEITAGDKTPCEAGSAHYCNVPCPTLTEPKQMCWTPMDCWGPKRIKIEGSAKVKVPAPGKGTVTRSGFYIHGGNPADAVSSGCVKSLNNDVFGHIRKLTGVKGAVPFCVGSACGGAVIKAVANSLSDLF